MTIPAPPSGDGVTPASVQFSFPPDRKPRARPGVTVSEEPVSLSSSAPPAEPAVTPDLDPPQAPAQFLETSTATPRQSELDPGYMDLDLPSRFVFYPFKQLSATQIRGKHQAKFALAARKDSTRLVVEAVSSLLGDGVQAKDLTISDFFAVMYWLRINCYGKVTFPVNVRCDNAAHVKKVVDKVLPATSLENSQLISATTLKEVVFDEALLAEFMARPEVSELAALGYSLTAPRIWDSVELEEEWLESPQYAEVEFLTELAGSIMPLSGKRLTLTQRLEIVGNLPPEMISLLREWQVVVQSYGIEESISLKCKECGSQIVTDLSISAHDFL